VPLVRYNPRLKTDLRMRVKDQLQDLEEAHVGDVVGEGENGTVASDRMARHRNLEDVEMPPRQILPMPQSPQRPQLPLQDQQLPTHLKAQEALETDETEEATEGVPEVQLSKGEAYSQWGPDDNSVAG
jgi:hypothetical protein